MNRTPQEIYLNSDYATMYVNGSYLSDMLFYFDQPITKPKDYSISLRISSFIFPISFMLVNGNNDTLVIDGITYTLTHGNYNALTFKTHLLTLLPATYSISYDTITLKYTITNPVDFTIESTSTCLELLGFTDNDHTSGGHTITSDSVVNFTGTNIVYVDIPNISTFNLSSKSGGKTSIIKSIPITTPHGNMMYYTNDTGSSVYLQEEALTFFHIRILGEDLITPIDFNNQHWNMTIEVSFILKEEVTPITKLDFQSAYQNYLIKLKNKI